MNLFVEMFDDSEPTKYKAVPTVPDLDDFFWLEGAKQLSDRQAADSDIRQVVLTELLDCLVGEVPAEPKIQKVYSDGLIKSIFGGVVRVAVSGPSPAVNTSPASVKKPSPSERRQYLRQLVEDAGITTNDVNRETIERLLDEMEVFVDGNVKAARAERR
jgi:hypothetical protein